MKTLNEYMSMSYKMEIIEDQDEGGFVISYPDLPGCITCGDDKKLHMDDRMLGNVRETRLHNG